MKPRRAHLSIEAFTVPVLVRFRPATYTRRLQVTIHYCFINNLLFQQQYTILHAPKKKKKETEFPLLCREKAKAGCSASTHARTLQAKRCVCGNPVLGMRLEFSNYDYARLNTMPHPIDE